MGAQRSLAKAMTKALSNCVTRPTSATSASPRSSPCRCPPGPYDAAALHTAFERLYRETFGYVADGEPVELVNLRLSAIGTARAGSISEGCTSTPGRSRARPASALVSFARGEPRVKARLLPRAAVEQGPVAGPPSSKVTTPPSSFRLAAPRARLGAGCIAIEMEETDA